MASESPGWQAIDDALRPLYGKRKPVHYGTVIKYALGGEDPLDGISVYKNDRRVNSLVPHWHYVTYGYSELYQKESEAADVSGWGFEMTFRLACRAGAKQPPTWPLNFLQNLARYVFQSGNPFGEGHHLDLNGPIALGESTDIRAIVFVADPQLPARDTPNGRLAFLQAVGITLDEWEALQVWSPEGLIGLLAREGPLLVTDLGRPSLLQKPEAAQAMRDGARREGSTTPRIYNAQTAWKVSAGKKVEVAVGANTTPMLARLLDARLSHGRDFELRGREQSVRFRPSTTFAARKEGKQLTLELPAELLHAITSTLLPQRGVYTLPGLSFRVLPTEIEGADGQVVQTIG